MALLYGDIAVYLFFLCLCVESVRCSIKYDLLELLQIHEKMPDEVLYVTKSGFVSFPILLKQD